MRGLLLLDHLTIEGLSNNGGDGSKNVAQKVNLSCFKLYRSYSISFNLSNVVDFFQELNSEGLYLSSQREKRSRCQVVITSSMKREIRKFLTVDGSDDHEMYGTKA